MISPHHVEREIKHSGEVFLLMNSQNVPIEHSEVNMVARSHVDPTAAVASPAAMAGDGDKTIEAIIMTTAETFELSVDSLSPPKAPVRPRSKRPASEGASSFVTCSAPAGRRSRTTLWDAQNPTIHRRVLIDDGSVNTSLQGVGQQLLADREYMAELRNALDHTFGLVKDLAYKVEENKAVGLEERKRRVEL